VKLGPHPDNLKGELALDQIHFIKEATWPGVQHRRHERFFHRTIIEPARIAERELQLPVPRSVRAMISARMSP
jgi:hypothetical protein